MAKEREELSVHSLLDELKPEELEPRLEMQILVDPLAELSTALNNVNCRDGGNCKVDFM